MHIKTTGDPGRSAVSSGTARKSPPGVLDVSALLYVAFYCVIVLSLLRADAAFCQAADKPDYSSLKGIKVLRIEIAGNKKTREYVILRELQMRVGDSLDLATMEADAVRLTKLPALSKVEIVPRLEGDGVVCAITVNETAPFIPTVLPGNSEENGWYAGPMLSTPNWFGRAITASVSAQWGGMTKYSFSANNPWLFFSHRQLSLSVGTAYQEREDKIRESNEISSTSAIRTTFFPGRNRLISVGLGFKYQRTMSDKPGVTLSPSNHDHLHRLELLFRVNTIQDPLDPRSGWVAGVQEMRTGGFLGGDGDSWRTQVDVARYLPLFARSSLAVGGVIDHQTGAVARDIPEYLQYSLGGGNSIRGYSRTDLGKVLYGKNQFLGTVEYSYRIMIPHQIQLFGKSFLSFRVGMNVVGFVDYGVAWTEAHELNMDRSRTGCGVGLHIMVPGIERIRLDVAFSQDGDMKFHIGTRSKLDAQR